MSPYTLPVPQPIETNPKNLRWGIVTTVKAPLSRLARFLAFHLDLGVHRIHVHLDQPDPAMAERLAHPRVRFTQCDDAYWSGKPNRARESHHFKRPASGAVKRAIYPTFGAHVPGGFISTRSPKIIARTGLHNVRLGIHTLRHQGHILRGSATIPGLGLGHAHAPDFKTFQRHMAYRLDKGSYHDRQGKRNPLGHLIRVLMDDPDPNALRAFHTEMCVASPERLDLLAAHDILVTAHLDLDAKVAWLFGKLEG